MLKTGEMFNLFCLCSKKVLKTGEMFNMFNFLGLCSKKVLKTGEMFNMFNMFNPEGKYGKGIEHGTISPQD